MPTNHAPIPDDRIPGVDLSRLSEDAMRALRLEAMRRGLSFSAFLGQLVEEVSNRMLNNNLHTQPAA